MSRRASDVYYGHMNTQIVAVDHAVPINVQTAENLSPLIGRTAEWIRENAGVDRRYTSQLNDDPAKLVAGIARPIIDQWGVPDLVIHAGTMPRQLLPDTSVFVMRELGLSGIPGFTVNAACLSFLVAMRTATSFIADGSHQRILICSSEFGTHARNFNQPESAALIGDGAAAMMLSATEMQVGIRHYAMESWPESAELAEFRGGGFKFQPTNPGTTESDNQFHMDGIKLLRFMAPKLTRFLRRFLHDCQLEWKDIDLVVPHQTSGSGMKLLHRLGIPSDKIVDILSDYGNCAAASMPMALSVARQEGRIQVGDNILLLGTASGLSIGAALVRW